VSRATSPATKRDGVASRAENVTVYTAGLAQGIALVTFPAASTILTAPDSYDPSNSEYGTMFLPQVILAITTSLLGSTLAGRIGTKGVYLAGLAANLAAMTLLIASRFVLPDHASAYAVLLVATACLGTGFGLTTPVLNIFAAAFHPDAIDRSVLVLNALLGLGTTLAPVFVAVFVGLGFWEGMPLLAGALLLVLFLVSLRLPLQVGPQQKAADTGARSAIPAQFWLFAAFAMLYGFCETMNGNWSQLDLTSNLGASTTVAALALTVFWAMVTVGRVLLAVVQRWFPSRFAFHVLPIMLACAFVLIAVLPKDSPELGILAFALAGLGCSALLPLSISFGQEKVPAMSAAMAGGVIAFYQLGYGVAAFGVGPLLDAGLTLPAVYGAAAVVALGMGALSFLVAHRRPSPQYLHPRPMPISAPG
jgi:MFS family permease